MKFEELELKGAFLITLDKHEDERGYFSRHFCKNELSKHGLDFNICQCNISKNNKKGTLRGMHYQKDPYPEIKLISCLSGTIYDVIVDLRKNSETYLKHFSITLTGDDNYLIYIPANFAHGFQTLEDNSIIYYHLNTYFQPDYYDGVRWNDPVLNIKWPETEHRIINERDSNYKLIQ